MINIGIQQSKDREIVNISGSLTVEHAAEVKKAIQSALEKRGNNVLVLLGTVTKTDLTFFQVVCSAHKTAMTAGKTFNVEQFQQDTLMSAHRTMGFTRKVGCSWDKTKSCVFMLMSGVVIESQKSSGLGLSALSMTLKHVVQNLRTLI